MYQVAVIGDRDSVIGFRALGMTVIEADDPETAARELRALVDRQYAVIFLTEPVAEANQAYLKTLRARRLPAVIPIPSAAGSTGLGMRQIRESVKKAVGLDLFDGEKD